MRYHLWLVGLMYRLQSCIGCSPNPSHLVSSYFDLVVRDTFSSEPRVTAVSKTTYKQTNLVTLAKERPRGCTAIAPLMTRNLIYFGTRPLFGTLFTSHSARVR